MRIGLYPGTFDPITLGHVDIIRRASMLVDRLVIGVAINRDKGPLFSFEERVEMIEHECAALSADTGTEIIAHPFENLLINCAHYVGVHVIVRGLRAFSDFEYDFQNWSSDGGSTSGQTGAYYAISSYVVVKSSTEISSPAIID